MLRTQRKFSKDMKQYCINHYQESGLYSENDKTSLEFYEAYHGCL